MKQFNVEKDITELGEARFEVHSYEDGYTVYWLQCGIAGMYMEPDQLADVYELLDMYIESFDEEDEDDGTEEE